MKKKFADISKPGQGKLKNALAFASFMVSRPGYQLFKKAAKKLSARAGIGGGQKISYDEWAKAASNADVLKKEYDAIFPTLKIKPQIGIILPEMNGEAKEIQISIDSVLTQSYANLQLFIVANSDNNTEELRKIYTEQDKRIRLSLKQEDLTTTGVDYLLFMKPDHVLAPNCLLAFAGHINNHPNDELVYCDEDTIDQNRHLSKPYFKPDWAPDNLLSGNYIGNAALIKKELLVKCAVVNTAAVASDTFDDDLIDNEIHFGGDVVDNVVRSLAVVAAVVFGASRSGGVRLLRQFVHFDFDVLQGAQHAAAGEFGEERRL